MASKENRRSAAWRWGARMACIALLCAMPLVLRAENNCPWMNEATASGLLGASAVGTYTEASAAHPAECSFVQNGDGGSRVLTITVEVTPDAHDRVGQMMHGCEGGSSPLGAIGNEAALCAVSDRKNRRSGRVIGRVRDQVFSITMTSTLKMDAVLSPQSIPSRISLAAEQVSGNLF